jgi:hypothetical protein
MVTIPTTVLTPTITIMAINTRTHFLPTRTTTLTTTTMITTIIHKNRLIPAPITMATPSIIMAILRIDRIKDSDE